MSSGLSPGGAADNSSKQRRRGDDEDAPVAIRGPARCLPTDRRVPRPGKRHDPVASPDARGTMPTHRGPGGDGRGGGVEGGGGGGWKGPHGDIESTLAVDVGLDSRGHDRYMAYKRELGPRGDPIFQAL